MNDPQRFIDQVDDMLQTLGLPPGWGIEETDDLEAYEEELSDLQIIFCFPNLSPAERELIAFAARVHRRVLFLTTALTERETYRSSNVRQKTEGALSHARENYKDAVDQMEQYGLRAKLTDFQERLLECFLQEQAAER